MTSIFKSLARRFGRHTAPPSLEPVDYHVAYFQCCGYAAMVCAVPVTACSEQEIRERFPRIAHEQNPGKAIQLAYGDRSIEEIHLKGENPDGACPLCLWGQQ